MLIHDISRENIYIFVYPVLSHWSLIKKKEKKKKKKQLLGLFIRSTADSTIPRWRNVYGEQSKGENVSEFQQPWSELREIECSRRGKWPP